MDNFPPNSRRARTLVDEPKNIERVTSAEAVRRKRGLGRQFKDTFIGGSAKMAVHYMMLEVVIPAIQDTLIDAFQGGIEKLIRGESRSHRPRSMMSNPYGSLGHVDYKGVSTSQRPKPPTSRMLSRSARARHDFSDIVIQSRQEAEEVIERLYDLLSRYGSASVGDLYELTGIASSHVDQKWGWTNLSGTRASALRSGGYLLILPDPESFE